MKPLDYVVEQLWAPALTCPDLRLAVNTPQDHTWRDVERYWVIPNESSARLLVPHGPRAMESRYLTNYRHLRRQRKNISRLALGAAVTAGMPVSRTTVALQSRGAPTVPTPLALLTEALGQPVYAAVGVRTSDNRKATLQLVDAGGHPLGFAKMGWDATTDALITTEIRALRLVGGRPGPTRAPRILAELDYYGHPVVVTEAMPEDVTGGPNGAADPTAQEMFALTPVVRHAAVGATRHFASAVYRLRLAEADPVTRDVATAGLGLAHRLEAMTGELPVTTMCHGDMAPWNRARERAGQLWVWDWEHAEDDAVAGLDAINWMFSRHRIRQGTAEDVSLDALLDQADGYLTAAGVARSGRPVVAAAWALEMAGRACSMAGHAGHWSAAVMSPGALQSLLTSARLDFTL